MFKEKKYTQIFFNLRIIIYNLKKFKRLLDHICINPANTFMVRLAEVIHYKKGLTKITHLELFSFPSVKLAG
jgi:hypothetical protein